MKVLAGHGYTMAAVEYSKGYGTTYSKPVEQVNTALGFLSATQAVALAQRLGGLRVHVETLFFPTDHAPSLPYEYQFNLNGQAGQEALNRMLAFLEGLRKKG